MHMQDSGGSSLVFQIYNTFSDILILIIIIIICENVIEI